MHKVCDAFYDIMEYIIFVLSLITGLIQKPVCNVYTVRTSNGVWLTTGIFEGEISMLSFKNIFKRGFEHETPLIGGADSLRLLAVSMVKVMDKNVDYVFYPYSDRQEKFLPIVVKRYLRKMEGVTVTVIGNSKYIIRKE